MKNTLPILILLVLYSCQKKAETLAPKIDSIKIIDSINTARTKINDSILSHNRFGNWEGTHSFSHGMIAGKGTIIFSKIGRDEYNINGEKSNGKEFIKITGKAEMLSDRHMSFTGTIKQSFQDYDNGKLDVRRGKRTFLTKDGGKTFKLQESINSAGFSDQIFIIR